MKLVTLTLILCLCNSVLGKEKEKDIALPDILNNDDALAYLGMLKDKHAQTLEEEMAHMRENGEEFKKHLEFQKLLEEDKKKTWYIKNTTLTEVDESFFNNLKNKLAASLPGKAGSMLKKVKFQNLGLYIFGIGETNIFDDLEI
ncbi:uncharacterized protein NDAI_0H00700 [Naumovozyma dairenensis CBS 421]|uniref:Uncharacterized protein n=1 Tax=Naumovozyma dairenensis (strain ATCC 10597 / BCRC 20456 / CBS 421 / NBRC 0211 / NRRL Y-12639) TaxID=1071378 RepID=G0WEN3_NAUDC|nr:hypothetical protein NDAI_0H00700 [Naumovozyma dairenensis CBS 421]CCD26244.1 hypothetical protein NDAI_0H00700 [Naumovozyma dairenensis CBS 421]